MTAALASIKLPADLVDEARREAAVFSRSISGQVEHWARIGKAIEAAPGFTLDRVRAALDGRCDPEELTEHEWELFDELRFQSIGEPTAENDAFFAALKTTDGAVGYDENDRLVRVRADGTHEVIG